MSNETMINEIEVSYKKLVDLACDQGLDFNIDNSSKGHAKYIISKIINSSKEVNILFSKFIPEIFLSEEISSGIKAKNNVKIKFLIGNISSNDLIKLKDLSKELEIRQILPDKISNGIDFIIGDSKRIRVNLPNNPFQAKVNFNTPSNCKPFISKFNELWGNSTAI